MTRGKQPGGLSLLKISILAYVLIAPAFILFLIYIAFPIVYNFAQSTQSQTYYGTTLFTGMKNFKYMLSDPIFWSALKNNLIWFVLCVGVQTILAFLFALLYQLKLMGRGLFKAVLFVPVVLSPVVIGLVWEQIYNPSNGIIAVILGFMGDSSPPDWLGNPNLALISVAFVNIWQWTGFSMLLYIAALQNIPAELYEVATVDGAGNWAIINKILVPLVEGTTGTLVILGFIGSLQTFTLVYVMTAGGPDNSSHVLGTYIFQQAFVQGNFGYGSALSVVLLIITLLLTLIQLRLFNCERRLN